jgi:hypothetical protein
MRTLFKKDGTIGTCKYCGEFAEYPMKSGDYCCSSHVLRCPHQKEAASKRRIEHFMKHPGPKGMAYAQLGTPDALCYICNKVALYVIPGSNLLCCGKKAHDCGEYSRHTHEYQLRRYELNPKLKDTMKRVSLDVHRRPEVIAAKKKAMEDHHANEDWHDNVWLPALLEGKKRQKEKGELDD